MLPWHVSLSSRERLDGLRLFSLEGRRMRGVFIEVYIVMKGIDRKSAYNLVTGPRILKREGIGLR